MRGMEELKVVEKYLLYGQYPLEFTKVDKANLWQKCQQNFKTEEGTMYYRRNVHSEKELWKVCVQTDEEKVWVMESYHSGIEGKMSV